MEREHLLRRWMLFAVSALAIAGGFAFLAVLARTPAVQILNTPEGLHRAIAGHVTFALLVWLLAFEAVLWVLACGLGARKRLPWVGLGLAAGGGGLLVAAILRGRGLPILTDYVSVVVDPLFFVGLIALACGVGCAAWACVAGGAGAYPSLRRGMRIAAAVGALAVAACLVAFVRLGAGGGAPADFLFFQSLFWVSGHLLQFVNVIAMVCAWYLLLESGFGVAPPHSRMGRLATTGFLAIAAALFVGTLAADPRALPADLRLSIVMGVALALPTVIHIGIVGRALVRRGRWRSSPEAAALVCSLSLFAGGILLAVVRAGTGSSMWVPAHYHAVLVGGVTTAFMGLTYRLLAEMGKIAWPRLATVQPWLYGVGMLLMIIGMNWAGASGAPRKTFDPALGAAAARWVTPMNLMGLGGVVAVVGGAAFVLNALWSLLAPVRAAAPAGAAALAPASRGAGGAAWLVRWATLFKLRIAALIAFSGVAAAVLAAPTWPSAGRLALLALTLTLAAASAGALNHAMEVDIDARMARTRGRPLPCGQVRRGVVVGVALALMALALAAAALGINRVVALHLLGGGFVYVVVYTAWLKRRSALNIVIGGLAGSFAALAGGASVRPDLCLPPVLLAAIIFLWTPPHFWALAIVHQEDYRAAGVPMLPVVQGMRRTAWWILAHTAALVLVSLAPLALGARGPIYAATAAGLGIFYLWRNIQLVRAPSQGAARAAFRASLVYLTLLLIVMLADLRI